MEGSAERQLSSFRKVLRWGICSVLLLALVALGVLRFGNSQWNKYIYLFQANILPGQELGRIEPPRDFTGIWINWYPRGRRFVNTYKDGKKHGKYEEWFDGRKRLEGEYREGEKFGTWREWDETGNLLDVY